LVVCMAAVARIVVLGRLAVVLIEAVSVVEGILLRFAIVGFADQLFGTHHQRSSFCQENTS